MEDRGMASTANCMGSIQILLPRARRVDPRNQRVSAAGCVAREDCLEYALDNGEKFG